LNPPVKIFYGICGEGMGHAGRSIALIERLVAIGHDVTIFTFADALHLLSRSGYDVHEIDGLRFSTTSSGGVSPLGTLQNFAKFLLHRNRSLDVVLGRAIKEQPDLFITDFEPLTALAAASLDAPCISVDNQHKFCGPIGHQLPFGLRAYCRAAGVFVERWIRRPRQCIVAVFHDCPSTPHYRRVNTLLRDRMACLSPSAGDHVLIYARGEVGMRLVRAAESLPERLIVYGCRGRGASNVTYKATSYDEFAADLASCRAVICTAGQQLIGEAAYFSKPMLVVPIPRQHEQVINAHFVRQENLGTSCPLDQLTPARITRFLRSTFATRPPINGVDEAIKYLNIKLASDTSDSVDHPPILAAPALHA
jgi:uncharacterized protein (TIGR00661 family)